MKEERVEAQLPIVGGQEFGIDLEMVIGGIKLAERNVKEWIRLTKSA